MLYRVIHMCYMCSSSIFYMLTAACCGCFGSRKVLALPPQQQRSKSISPRPNTLTLSCTMPIPPRVVMTEI